MRLYTDLLHSPGHRYFFDLGSAPGIVVPGVGQVTLAGREPIAVERMTVFRTPATIVLTLNGFSTTTPTELHPAQASIAVSVLTAGVYTERVISPDLAPPVESPDADFTPTLWTERVISPDPTTLAVQAITLNVSQGGNVAFISPQVGTVTINGLTFLFGTQLGVTQWTIEGLVPDLYAERVIEPEVGTLRMGELAPNFILPFFWVDDRPAPSVTWISDQAA